MYADRLTTVEPFGIEQIAAAERHGTPRDLFALWFAANAETATFAVGILTIALYGTSFWGALAGIVIGNICGYAIVAALGMAGPRLGLPQMLLSRRVFGTDANVLAALLAFLAGVGWFGINSIFGASALAIVTHLAYLPALGIVIAVQIALAVYGYNMIHAFERCAGIILTLGFAIIVLATLPRVHLAARFDAQAPLAGGGEIAGIIYSAALAFSYAIGWGPCAADYSRYLPVRSPARAVWSWTFAGGALPSTALEIFGAATVTAVPHAHLADASPADVIFAIFGPGLLATIGLLTVTIGTLSANCLNLYSGSICALSAWDRGRRPAFAYGVAALFGALTAGILLFARVGPTLIATAAGGVALVCWLVVRYTLVRWQAALAVGTIGGAIALIGTQPSNIAHDYVNFLLLLSAWATPWAGAMLATARTDGAVQPGAAAPLGWLAGLAASLPFWQQSWYVGPLAAALPGIGDLSYFVGFSVAFAAAAIVLRIRRNGSRSVQSENSHLSENRR